MSSIVAVAGGSGGLGRSIVEALKNDGRYTPLVIARKANEELEKETGVRVLAADYSSVDALVKLFEDNNIDTVITVTGHSAQSIEVLFNLINAADLSKTTRRYIPNIFNGVNYQLEKHININPILTGKLRQEEELKKTNLEWTGIVPGIFLDYYAPGFPTHAPRFPLIVDVEHNVASIPGDGEMTQTFTHTTDIGKYTVAALSLDKWEQKYFVKGDALTWNQLVALAERVKGVKFDVTYDSAEKIEQGDITLIWGHGATLKNIGLEEQAIKKMMLTLAKIQLEGGGSFGPGSYLNEIFPEIKPLKMEKALIRSFQK